MPKREDEYWAARREPRGTPLCPRCGSTKVYYNRHYRSWRCGRCEYSFPMPSYGAGQATSHRNRHIGSTISRLHPRRQYLSGQFLILLLITILALAIIGYTYYHIHQLSRPVIIAIMASAGVVALWDITAMSSVRKYKARRYGTIFVSLVLVALLGCSAAAYAKVSPLYEAKNAVVESFHKVGSSAGQAIHDLRDTSVADYANKFNQYRQSKGLPPLEFTDDLNRVAELRLKELHTDFSHNSAGGYNRHLAENIAESTGFLSNSDALKMWQNSPGHNANMLNGGYKYTGYAIGDGYAVQVFTEYPTINGEPQLPPGWYWTY
jgi:uncharacterized protein YkwD/ribosomal protein L37AE/L43A